MKNIFKGYYKLGDEELQSLWENALFIFDTNVLLNLYRYQSTTSNELFTVMESLADRVWIPYHVGLEFQRNRLNVIGEQHKKFSEVKKIVGDSIDDIQNSFNNLQLEKRHSHINPDEFLKRIEEIRNDFFKELDELEEKGIDVNSEDKIRDRIDVLFMEKIGSKPENQKKIDEIFCEGEERYKNQIPPGFKDLSKESSDDDGFTYDGLIYKQKYGDFIIWEQIICYASEKSVENLIFVTDDQKADWWWKIKSDSPKMIGVRPELRDEISRRAGVENFHVFNSESFLYYANKQPDVQVAEEAIKEVREVSDDRRERIMRSQTIRQLVPSTKKAVYEWLSHNFPHLDLEQSGRSQLEFISYHDGQKFGFEVRFVQSPQVVMYRLPEMVYRYYYILNEEGFYEITIIFVVLDEELIPELRSLIRRGMLEAQRNLRIIIGKAEYSEEEERVYDFTPYDDFTLGDPPG